MAETKNTVPSDFQGILDSVLASLQTGNQTPSYGTRDDFDALYQSILNGMGDNATLQANIEAALRPQYDRSIQELNQQRIERNAEIDVDAASRGMGNSTWVTDAKLRQMRGTEDAIADLNANYNTTLYNALADAIKDRDTNAYNQAWAWWTQQQQAAQNEKDREREDLANAYNIAMNWWNQNNAKKSSGSKGNTPTDWTKMFDEWWSKNHSGDDDVPPVEENTVLYGPPAPPKKPTNTNPNMGGGKNNVMMLK